MLKPTVRDIAAASQVSVATVSRALNNRDGVHEETRRKVIQIAHQLGYEMSQQKQPVQGSIAVVFSKEDSYYIGQQQSPGVGWCFDEDVYEAVFVKIVVVFAPFLFPMFAQ